MTVGHFPLDDKTIVITGGGSGINLSFVHLVLERPGTKILICDLKLTDDAASCVLSPRVAFMQCDVSRWSDLERIPSEVTKAFGPDIVPDVWVAGAGVFEPSWSSWLHDTEETHYQQMSINAEHPIKLTRVAMRSLLGAGKAGVVLIVSSMAGIGAQYAAPLYCASKHAAVGFTKSMMQADIDEGLKVVCVCPGMVNTPLWTGKQGEEARRQFGWKEDTSISSEEVAQAMLEMVEDKDIKYPGGSLLEVSKGRLRGDLESRQSIVIDGSSDMKAWADHCYAPVREVFRKERRASSHNGSL